jgi:hypothetical protein
MRDGTFCVTAGADRKPMTKVPQIHFDTDDLPQADRFERWRAAIPTYEALDLSGPGQFRAIADAWMLGEFIVTVTRLTREGGWQRPFDLLPRKAWKRHGRF